MNCPDCKVKMIYKMDKFARPDIDESYYRCPICKMTIENEESLEEINE